MPIDGVLSVETSGAPMSLFCAGPDSPAPAVILYGDNAGVREELRGLTRELAGHGFFVVLADPYYRSGDAFEPPLSAADRARISPLREALTLGLMAADVRSIADALSQEARTDRPGVALVGLCIGSGFVLAGLEELGSDAVGAAIIDGCELGDRLGRTPQLLPPVPVQLSMPAALSKLGDDLESGIDRLGATPVRERDHPDVSHGVCFESWPGSVYDGAARSRAVEAAAAFLREAFADQPSRR